MIKKLLAVLVLSVVMIPGMASATTPPNTPATIYKITGAIVLSGSAPIGTPVVIPFNSTKVFLSALDCTNEIDRVLKLTVTSGTSNNAGLYTGNDPTKFGAIQVTKVNALMCTLTDHQ